jgi:dTDP-4-amino-4,6-dideoxygalactose transaminase
MNKERMIGGEFELDWEDFTPSSARLVKPFLPGPHVRYLSTGRAAISLAIQNVLHRGAHRIVWMPAYTCKAVLQPFIAAGMEIRFYGMGRCLFGISGLPENIENQCFLFIHYFGKYNHDASRWILEKRKTQEFFVIEDCAQATLNSNVGRVGDYSINSFRKFLAQPDGAELSSTAVTCGEIKAPDEEFLSRRLVGKLVRGRVEDQTTFLSQFERSEDLLDADNEVRKMSWLSYLLLTNADTETVRVKRRRNFMKLAEILSTSALKEHIHFLFTTLDAEEVPLGFPIIVLQNERDKLREHLRHAGVFCPVHWHLNHVSGRSQFHVEHELSKSLLTLPIDQRYDEADMAFINEILHTLWSCT